MVAEMAMAVFNALPADAPDWAMTLTWNLAVIHGYFG